MHFSLFAFLVAAPMALTYPVLETRQASSTNLQSFTGTLGGAAPPITNSGDSRRQFEVNGNTFVNFAAAAQRSCDIQQNACSNAANAGKGGSVAACQTQQAACNAAASSGPQSFSGAGTSTTTTPPPATSSAAADTGDDTTCDA